ncbi:MAG: hypothetical protein ACYCSQ_04245 [bacterium]
MEINLRGGESSLGKETPGGYKIKTENGFKESVDAKNSITADKKLGSEVKSSDLYLNKIRNIHKGESEIKLLLNSGFMIKNDEYFLCNTYGFIDKDVRNNFNDLFLKNNFVEVQGASFNSMTSYGRNITIKNLIMSSEKFNEINSAKYANRFYKHDDKFNNEYKLSEWTLKNYFTLKQNNTETCAINAAPGIVNLGQPPNFKQIKYALNETPSVYKFKYNGAGQEKEQSVKKPELGIFKDYKETMDGFKNIKVSINERKVIEMESIHNWQRIMDYIKERDALFLKDLNADKKGRVLERIEVHHINQLQDGGKENVNNLIAIGENTHRLADSYKILMDKNTGYYREHYFNASRDAKIANKNKGQEFLKRDEYSNGLSNALGKLDLSDKILLHGVKLEVESNSAMRLKMVKDAPEDMRLLFIDAKTGEELRLFIAKTDNETDKNITKTALANFIKELTTSI